MVVQITVDPFRGVEIDGAYVSFGTHWQAVEEKLGAPEHRYVGYTPDDALMILGKRGEHIQDYLDVPLPKGGFEEERNGIRFIYRDFLLVTVWVSGETVVAVGEVLLHGNGI